MPPSEIEPATFWLVAVIYVVGKDKGKDEVHHITGQEGPEGE